MDADSIFRYHPHDLRLRTLPQFLVGVRPAILDVAACRQSLFLGALLVLSAGFAREYDAEDLLHAPWYVLVPLAASLATSFVLYSILLAAVKVHSENPPEFWPGYGRFLAIYWMTAPLAWLYAVPVEQYLSAVDSVRANLAFLGIVALWRVLLMARCAVVLFGASYWGAFLLVMFFADTLAMAILFFTPLPLFDIMGGISLTESETIIRRVACDVQGWGGLSWPFWAIATFVYFNLSRRGWQVVRFRDSPPTRVSIPLWTLAAASLLIWVPILPATQPPRQLQRSTEEKLLAGNIDEALEEMSAHDQSDYPPHWDPPPWPGYGQRVPSLVKVLQATLQAEVPVWVREIFWEKLLKQMENQYGMGYWEPRTDEDFNRYMQLFESLAQFPEEKFLSAREVVIQGLRNLSNYDDNRKARIVEVLKAFDIAEPQPAQPDPVEPEPVEPEPVKPEPTAPGSLAD